MMYGRRSMRISSWADICVCNKQKKKLIITEQQKNNKKKQVNTLFIYRETHNEVYALVISRSRTCEEGDMKKSKLRAAVPRRER